LIDCKGKSGGMDLVDFMLSSDGCGRWWVLAGRIGHSHPGVDAGRIAEDQVMKPPSNMFLTAICVY
jgi:hypothetical protein